MDIAKILTKLNVFAWCPRAFTFGELLDFIEPSIDERVLRTALVNNSRVIRLHGMSTDEDRFILDSILFQWFSSLNVRLAQVQQFRLTERQLALVMSHLRHHGRWDSVPEEPIRWAQSLGFVGTCCTRGEYVFPLARVLSFLSPSSIRVVTEVLRGFCDEETWKQPLGDLLKNSLQEGFSPFNKRVAYIVQGREGLLTSTEMTLEQIGAFWGLTRERVRQLESKFWEALQSRSERMRRPFLVALICDFIGESGSLIVKANSSKAPVRRFLAKCAGIDMVELPPIGFLVLATSREKLTSLISTNRLPNAIAADAIAEHLDTEDHFSLIRSDVKTLAERIAQYRLKSLGKSGTVYLALRAIGRPAHYTKVTQVLNSLFPDQQATEHNVHAILNRARYGMVWIGAKGTYALKEWGYQRPSKKLFDAVTEIVDSSYKATGKPVPFTVIMAQIGKYRQLMKPSSLLMAAHFNPNLQCVSRDCFIPKGANHRAENEFSVDQLDKILEEFQNRNEMAP